MSQAAEEALSAVPSPAASAGGADHLREEALRVITLSDVDVESLASMASKLAPSVGNFASVEEQEQWEAKEKIERENRLRAFRDALLDREVNAYQKGRDEAHERRMREMDAADERRQRIIDEADERQRKIELEHSEAIRASNIRSYVLLLVVLAVVSMPIIAIAARLTPSDFGTFIAPITGIAGTVVGYWFGSGDRSQTKT